MVGDIYGKKVDVLVSSIFFKMIICNPIGIMLTVPLLHFFQEKYGLTSDVVASSFGKLEPSMVTNNIGQVAYLNA